MRKLAGWLVLLCVVIGLAAALVRHFHRGAQVKQQVHALRQAVTPQPQVSTEAPDPKRRIECEAALNTVNRNGAMLKNWKVYGAHVNVRVRSAFYHADLEHKQSLDKALRCIVAGGRERDQGLQQVTYRDSRNDELVALWDRSNGFKLSE